LGSGGSILTLPILVYGLGIDPHEAVTISLIVVGSSGLVGAIIQYREGNLNLKAAALFAGTGLVGAYLGSQFTNMVAAPVLMIIFGCVMAFAGTGMIVSRPGYSVFRECRPYVCLATGLLAGIMTGFLGVGGGFLIVPALIFFAGISMKEAAGTSLAVIALNSASGSIGQLKHSAINWELSLLFLLFVLCGMAVGLVSVKKFRGESLKNIFAVLIITIGLYLIISNAINLLN
jgi:uncharacterized membrane protein YfcA